MDTTLFWTEGKGRFPAKEFKTVAEAQGWLGNLILREGNRGADSRIRQAKMAKGVLDEALAEARKPKKRIIIARG
jgi:hypothetical protein